MKKLFLVLFFSGLAMLFVWLLIKRPEFSLNVENRRSPRTIIPVETNGLNSPNSGPNVTATYDESRIQPLVMLENNEIFLQALSVDLNRDGVMDQVCAIRKAGSTNVYLVAGTQNPITGEFTRLPGLQTSVTQARTLLLYSADIIGDRSNTVIVSGMTSDNFHSLSVYLPEKDPNGTITFVTIVDLHSDGPITIKEAVRSDAYNLGITTGESHSIHTYNSDPEAPETLDQIERIYHWNRRKKRYEQVSESRIPGKRLESRMVSQLQGATLETFENFLNGLWYMPASKGTQGTQHLFFDTTTREITFHNTVVQEVFLRESGAPRRYGAYMTTRNKSISSIRRMIDIELTGIDEIKIKVLEDVKLKIGVASDWDGVYRKMSTTAIQVDRETAAIINLRDFLTAEAGSWISPDGQELRILEKTYTLSGHNGKESGKYALLTIKEQLVLQLRTETGSGESNSFYLVSIDNHDALPKDQTLSLTEISVSIEGIRMVGSDLVKFSRNKTKN